MVAKFVPDLGTRLGTEDWLRMAEPVGRYADLPLGSGDASVITAGERLAVGEVRP
jgi:hypothetical protein